MDIDVAILRELLSVLFMVSRVVADERIKFLNLHFTSIAIDLFPYKNAPELNWDSEDT